MELWNACVVRAWQGASRCLAPSGFGSGRPGPGRALILCLSPASDEDNKPLQGSQTSLDGTIKQQESDDSLVDYGEGGEGQFNEDGSFIGQYTVRKDKEETEGNESSEATSPVNAIYSLA